MYDLKRRRTSSLVSAGNYLVAQDEFQPQPALSQLLEHLSSTGTDRRTPLDYTKKASLLRKDWPLPFGID
jgi:hypothetical protein